MHIIETIDIPRPAAEVFAVVGDHRNDAAWRAGVREMTGTPAGTVEPGTTVHEVLRFAGSTHVTDTVVTTVGPGHTFAYEGGGSGGRVRGRRSVEAIGPDACRVTTELEVETTGRLRRLEPVLVPLFRRGTRRDLRRLRALAAVSEGARTLGA